MPLPLTCLTARRLGTNCHQDVASRRLGEQDRNRKRQGYLNENSWEYKQQQPRRHLKLNVFENIWQSVPQNARRYELYGLANDVYIKAFVIETLDDRLKASGF